MATCTLRLGNERVENHGPAHHIAGEMIHFYGPDPVDLADIDFSLRRSETSTGIALLPEAVLRAALGGYVRRIVVDSAGVVINMGRRQRLFTGAAREAAKLMAHRCDFRGCDIPVTFAEVDHIDEWQQDNGTTDQNNASVAHQLSSPAHSCHRLV